jgi:chromosome segregation ATPase
LSGRAAEAERELAEAHERLATVEQTTKALATSEQALRQELESLTRTDLGDNQKGRGGRRSKVSARAYGEAIEQLEREQAERARLEQETAALAEQVTKLEAQAAEHAATAAVRSEATPEPESPTPAQAAVEADLRHLLATAQRELDEARAALSEQQARYAAVASEVVAETAVASTPAAAQPADEKPWTAVDDDLLSRLQRAKQFAGGN